VARQQFGLVLGDFGELAFKDIGDAGVKSASRPMPIGLGFRHLVLVLKAPKRKAKGPPCEPRPAWHTPPR
jgi:hypothetical protein